MSKTTFFKGYIILRTDINKIDEENVVDKLIKCKNNCFHSFKFDCICDVKFKDISVKKTFNKAIRDDGLIKKRIEMILAQTKNLGFIEIDKLILKCWGDFSNINIS